MVNWIFLVVYKMVTLEFKYPTPLSLSNINHFYFMCIDFFPALCVWVPSECLVSSEVIIGHKNPMELELQVVVRHYVGAGNQIWFLWKNIQCF